MAHDVGYLRLFPLSLVLFPGVSVPLHIFEERYKLMISECVEKDEPFGIILARTSGDDESPEQPHEVGTAASVVQVEKLEDGRMNIIARGDRRFRIVDLIADRPYLAANVEFVEPPPIEEQFDSPLVDNVRDLFERYVSRLVELAGHHLQAVELPETPEMLASVVASLLDVPLEGRQMLLEETDTRALLGREAAILEEHLKTLESAPESRPVSASPLDWREYSGDSSRN